MDELYNLISEVKAKERSRGQAIVAYNITHLTDIYMKVEVLFDAEYNSSLIMKNAHLHRLGMLEFPEFPLHYYRACPLTAFYNNKEKASDILKANL